MLTGLSRGLKTPDFSVFCTLRCAVLFKPTSLSVKKTAHAGIRHERFFV